MMHEHDFHQIALNGQNHFVECMTCKICYCNMCGKVVFGIEDAARHRLGKCIGKVSDPSIPSLHHQVDLEVK